MTDGTINERSSDGNVLEPNGNANQIKQLFGSFVFEFQIVEQMVGGLVMQLADLEYEIGCCLTSEMSFKALVQAFSSIAGTKLGGINNLKADWPELIQLRADLFKLEEYRNRIIHSCYIELEENVIQFKTTAKKADFAKTRTVDFDKDELSEQILEAYRLKNEIVLLVARLIAAGHSKVDVFNIPD